MTDPANALAISVYENKGVYALLLGSGLSMAAQIPTGWDITLSLVKRVAAMEGVQDEPDWAAWHQQRFGAPPDYSKLLEQLTQTPDERRALLHGYIAATPEDVEQGRRTPTAAHRAIARLVRDGFIRVIITTNFDRLTENALREVGVEPTVIKSDDDLSGALPLIHAQCFILKVHGDYLDARLRNTDAELAAYSAPMNQCLDRILDEHGLIVCGWSATWDPALRGAVIRAPSRRFPMFWASRGVRSLAAEELIRHRAGREIMITDADSFFVDLQQKVGAQQAMQRDNPISLDILVATAKRYLARPEHRIDLHDLMMKELRRTQEKLTAAAFSQQESCSAETFKRRLNIYESSTEPLARLAFAVGRWGDGAETPIMRDILQALGLRTYENGPIVWNNLKTYPGVLIYLAYSLGAAKTGRLNALRAWFTQTLYQPHLDKRDVAVNLIFSTTWDGARAQMWQMLPELKDRTTPLQDHLHDLCERWFADEFLSATDMSLTFQWLEVLAAIEVTAAKEPKDQLERSIELRRGKPVWIPVGRVGCDETFAKELDDRITTAPGRQALLDAGFADGDRDYLEQILANLDHILSSTRW